MSKGFRLLCVLAIMFASLIVAVPMASAGGNPFTGAELMANSTSVAIPSTITVHSGLDPGSGVFGMSSVQTSNRLDPGQVFQLRATSGALMAAPAAYPPPNLVMVQAGSDYYNVTGGTGLRARDPTASGFSAVANYLQQTDLFTRVRTLFGPTAAACNMAPSG